jgi:hypothetical protein
VDILAQDARNADLYLLALRRARNPMEHAGRTDLHRGSVGAAVMATNPHVDSEYLERWCRSDDWRVRWAAWQNPSTPVDLVVESLALSMAELANESRSGCWVNTLSVAPRMTPGQLGVVAMMNAAGIAARSQKIARLLLSAPRLSVVRGALAFYQAEPEDRVIAEMARTRVANTAEFSLNPSVPASYARGLFVENRAVLDLLLAKTRGDWARLGELDREGASQIGARVADEALGAQDPLWWLSRMVYRGLMGGLGGLATIVGGVLNSSPEGWSIIAGMDARQLGLLGVHSPVVAVGTLLEWPWLSSLSGNAGAVTHSSLTVAREVSTCLDNITSTLDGRPDRWDMWLETTSDPALNLDGLVRRARVAANLLV